MKGIFLIITLSCFYRISAQDTITVMSYNVLKYPLSNASKADTLKPIIEYVKPDIFMITEFLIRDFVSDDFASEESQTVLF